MFFKIKSNRTELEPTFVGSIRALVVEQKRAAERKLAIFYFIIKSRIRLERSISSYI